MSSKYLLNSLIALTIAALPATASAASSTYYEKAFGVNGSSISPWYSNDNSWGYNNNSGQGFMTLYLGNQWNQVSPSKKLPAKVSAVNQSFTSTFDEYHTVNSGGWIDACWDNFCDSTVPGNRNGSLEIMIWTSYQGTQPISYNWNSNGTAKPVASNVSVSGKNWNICVGSQSSSGAPNGTQYTASFLATSQTGTNNNLKMIPFITWCINNKSNNNNQLGGNSYGPNTNWYITSIGAGWEYKNGKGTCNGWNVSGL